MFTISKGDILNSKNSIAHCVSKDLSMSYGVALSIKNKFGRVIFSNPEIGKCISVKQGDRFIFHMVTKQRYFHKPTFENFKKCFVDLILQCKNNNINNLDIPLIGCGLDKLDPKDVIDLINLTAKDENININMILFSDYDFEKIRKILSYS